MNVLHCSPADMTSFWKLATSSLHSIQNSLNEVNCQEGLWETLLELILLKRAFGFYERSLISQ
jgi:hypothetical protein